MARARKGFGSAARSNGVAPDTDPKRPGLLDEMNDLDRRRKERKKSKADATKSDGPDLDLGRIG